MVGGRVGGEHTNRHIPFMGHRQELSKHSGDITHRLLLSRRHTQFSSTPPVAYTDIRRR
jgi:hypothetical protein